MTLPLTKSAASDMAERILEIAMHLYDKGSNYSIPPSMNNCIQIAIESAWIETKHEIEIAKGTR